MRSGRRLMAAAKGGFPFRRAQILAAGLLALAGAAPYQPLLAPVRDVTVDYVVHPEGRADITVHVAIAAGGRRLHIESPDLPTVVLVDRDNETASILLPLLSAYADARIGRYDPERTVLARAHFTPGGPRVVDGQGCMVWHAVSDTGRATGCITASGVILRGDAESDREGRLGSIEARRVAFGPLPPAIFQVPPHFRRSPFVIGADGSIGGGQF